MPNPNAHSIVHRHALFQRAVKELLARGRIVPVHPFSALDARGEVALQAVGACPCRRLHPAQLGQRAHQLRDAVSQKIIGILDGAASQDSRGVHGRMQLLAALEESALPGLLEAAAKHQLRFVVDYQLGSEKLKRALGERALLDLYAQGHLPPQVVIGMRFGLGVAQALVGLQHQGSGKKAWRHARAAVLRAVEIGEIGVAEKPAPLGGQEAVEGIGTDEIKVKRIGLEQTTLIRTFAQHQSTSVQEHIS